MLLVIWGWKGLERGEDQDTDDDGGSTEDGEEVGLEGVDMAKNNDPKSVHTTYQPHPPGLLSVAHQYPEGSEGGPQPSPQGPPGAILWRHALWWSWWSRHPAPSTRTRTGHRHLVPNTCTGACPRSSWHRQKQSARQTRVLEWTRGTVNGTRFLGKGW